MAARISRLTHTLTALVACTIFASAVPAWAGNVSAHIDDSGGWIHINGNLEVANQFYLEFTDTVGNRKDVLTYWLDNIVYFNGGTNGMLLRSQDGNVDVLRIDAKGNVGIGTLTPSAKFHVAGDAMVDGNIAAKYQDVAEWVKAPERLAPGTVVIIDPKNVDGVVASDTAYDSRVAGVVSPKPGLLLGEPGSEKAKVAHSGRVKVKVDASYGPVAAGDLLVTSPTPGYAMRSEPVNVGGALIHRPGTLIGKALEPLDAGQGEILVLITLQ